MIAVIFATSLHFIMGPGGMHSFGHAAYFGLGAYGAALLVKWLFVPMGMALIAAPFVALAGALLFGWFAVRLSGVYLAMLTLAFAQIVWALVFQWEALTGGSNGVIGIWPPPPFDKAWVYFLLTLAFAVTGVLLLRRFLFAPFGYSMRAGRDSPLRAESIGIDVKRVHWLGFAIAGCVCGVAGGLFAFAKGSISPETIYVGRSIDGLVMVLLGGIQTLTGPIVGASVFATLQDTVMRQTEYWRALLGLIILLLVLAFPQGIVGAFSSIWPQSRSQAMSVLAVRSLSKAFGGVRAVNDVSFDIAQGEFLAMIGPNGAGKSTCFNMINGQLKPDSGKILFEGNDIAGLAPRVVWRLGVGRTFQVAATFGSMTVAENVQMALISHAHETYRLWRPAAELHRDRALDLLAQVGMRDAADRPSRELAYGDIKRIELAIALANEPRLLLMDEPTAGMAPRERNELIALVKRLVIERGISVLFTEHSMDVVFAFADRIIVLARGRLIADGRCGVHPRQSASTGGLFRDRQDLRGSASMSEAMLQVGSLSAWYGAARILYDLSFEVGRGEVVALMGRNGAGKSTTMKAVMGLVTQRKGMVRFNGEDISAQKPFEIARRGLGFTPEDRRIFVDLTVMENLDVGRQPPRRFADGNPAPSWTPEQLFKLFPNLAEMPDRLGGRMSGGEQQMLTVARTLMGNPLLVLLDEPSEGVAPLDRRADGSHNPGVEEAGAIDLAVGTEHPFCPAGVGSCLCAGKRSDPLAGLCRAARQQRRGSKNLSHGVGWRA